VAKRKQVNLAAWAKAHEAEAKRAERNAKAFAGDDIGDVWLTYAGRCRREAFDVLTRDPLPLPLELDHTHAPMVQAVTPSDANSWRDHLLALEAIDAKRFAEARS
jgi:hypothetical protein